MKMVWMAVPYTIVLAIVGLLSTVFILPEVTHYMYDHGWIHHYVPGAVGSGSGH
jgi:NhaB family Na+:H+ antiporter